MDLFMGNSLDIFGSKTRTKIYFFANNIKDIYKILSFKKLLTIQNTI